ncbi:TonB-dependent receptor [Ketogulonicigenium robustum]|uniref:TonB-dependent receptor n=1 Tax=Ketogulonicigenium robustum TaxID=92947 RepID=A0A1W6NXA7_9RHOB|nr:TonB-dependent receptor [Ketogulonicigenium robustum]ARO13872.1 TonB-dependent receptor [Ketogulonicigenium robustum]
MTFRALTTLSTLALTATASTAFAQSTQPVPSRTLGPIVISAGLAPIAANRTGVVAEVIEDADSGGQTALSTLLQGLPGFNLTQSGGYGQTSGFTLRGASQNYVPVFIDGIDVTDPSMGQVAFDFATLTTGGLQRIEVLPGSQSAIYGARAVGGAINITSATATQSGTHYRADAEYGSRNTRALSFGVAHLDDHLSATATLSTLATDGISAVAGGAEDDAADATRLGFNLAYTLDNGAVIGGAGFAARAHADYDDFGADADNTSRSDSTGVRLYADFDAAGLRHTVAISHYGIERDYDEAYGSTHYTGTRNKLSWLATTALSETTGLTFGADTTREVYDESGMYGASNGKNTITGVFAEGTFALRPDFDLSASIRHDDHSAFGSYDSARLAAVWRASRDWTLRGQVGNGFRAPSGYELFGPYGNAGLRPETSQSSEFSVEYALPADGFVRATWFDLKIDDLIDWVGGSYQQVAGTTHRQGAVIEGEVALTAWLRATASYTRTQSTPMSANVVGDAYLLGLAAQLGDATVARFDVKHAADRATLPDYTVANLAVTHDFTESLQGRFRIENLFDADYQLVSGYGTAGRSVFVGLGADF